MDELILAVRLAGGQNRLAVQIVLAGLVERAGRTWDRTSRRLLYKEKIRPLLQPGMAIMRSGILAILLGGLPVVKALWFSWELLMLAAGTLILGGLLLALMRPQGMVRNILVILLVPVMAFSAMQATATIGWVQRQTITFSAHTPEKTAGTYPPNTEPTISGWGFLKGNRP